MKHSYIIIDNDIQTTNALQLALENIDEFVCLGIADSESGGLELLLERTPSLVFLNVEMRNRDGNPTGFNLVNEIKKYFLSIPEFVILAKSTSFAIEGIRQDVLDYILKPTQRHFILGAVSRFKRRNKEYENSDVLCLKSYGDYKFVNTDEVLYLKADSNTTDLIRVNGTTVSAFKTLKYFEATLPNYFIRVHNSYIVNSNFISRIHFGKSQCSIKHTKASVPFSKSYRTNVEQLRKQLSGNSLIVA